MAKTPTAVRFPPGMLDDITDAAEAAGVSRNAWIVAAVQRSIADPLPTHETKLNSRPDILAGLDHAREHPEELRPRSRPDREAAPTPAPQVVEIESRQAATKWQWRVKGEEQPGGVVAFRREIEADARRKLAERFGHPVEVRHK